MGMRLGLSAGGGAAVGGAAVGGAAVGGLVVGGDFLPGLTFGSTTPSRRSEHQKIDILRSSVTDPGCLSRISDPSTASEEKFFCPNIFCSHKYHKIVNSFIFEQAKKIFLAKLLRIIILFTQKFVITCKLSKIWVWDPGSRIRQNPIPDPRSKRHRIPDPQHC
jgi:hypothetical protein